MAHPCFECGGECFCHGDIDDIIVSKTPKNCEGCGCIELMRRDDFDVDFEDEDDDDIIIGFECLGCGHQQNHGGQCDKCTGSAVDEIHY